jgi:hypothetical protein
MGFRNVVAMIPFCRSTKEADRVLEVMAAKGLKRGENGLKSTSGARSPRTWFWPGPSPSASGNSGAGGGCTSLLPPLSERRATHHRLGVNIAEVDYAKLVTLAEVVTYLEDKMKFGPA